MIEVACDESGYEGEKLIGTTTDVFAHASVRLDAGSATACMQELRNRIRSPATEYKATHLLRDKQRQVLEWILSPTGPLHGNAHVYLIDKAFYVVGKVVDLLVDGLVYPDGIGLNPDGLAKAVASDLYQTAGSGGFDAAHWQSFLKSANDLLRTNHRTDPEAPVEQFFRLVELLHRAGPPDGAGETLGRLARARPSAHAFRARLLDRPRAIPALDPLIPAIVRAVEHWGAGGTPVAIIHDRQNTLSVNRIAQLQELVGRPRPGPAGRSRPGRLASLTLVDSFGDARVQLADVLAGVARKLASDELNHRGDPVLAGLLRPYVDSSSIWAPLVTRIFGSAAGD